MQMLLRMEHVYEECKSIGVKAVARRLGVTCQQLLADLHHAGVAGAEGCPSQKEIAERCKDVQQSWNDDRLHSRWEITSTRAAG